VKAKLNFQQQSPVFSVIFNMLLWWPITINYMIWKVHFY